MEVTQGRDQNRSRGFKLSNSMNRLCSSRFMHSTPIPHIQLTSFTNTYKMGKRGAENDLNKDNASEDENSDDVSTSSCFEA